MLTTQEKLVLLERTMELYLQICKEIPEVKSMPADEIRQMFEATKKDVLQHAGLLPKDDA